MRVEIAFFDDHQKYLGTMDMDSVDSVTYGAIYGIIPEGAFFWRPVIHAGDETYCYCPEPHPLRTCEEYFGSLPRSERRQPWTKDPT